MAGVSLGDILLLEVFLFHASSPVVTQGLVSILMVEEPQQRNPALTDSPSEVAPKGSVQHLPDLENEQSKDSKGKGPVEAFPVQLDLTVNPQGENPGCLLSLPGAYEGDAGCLAFPQRRTMLCRVPRTSQDGRPSCSPTMRTT